MAKRKPTAAEKAGSTLVMVLMAIAAIIYFTIVFIMNVFSVSTFVDYGPSTWFDNILSFHVDAPYQATADLPVYEDGSIAALDDDPIHIIPAGRFFEWRGDRDGENVSYVAAQFYDGTERRTGFLILEKAPYVPTAEGEPKSPDHVGVLPVGSYDHGLPAMQELLPFRISAEDGGIGSSIRRHLLTPAEREDMRAALTIDYVSSALDRERIEESDDWVTVSEFSDENRLAYIPSSQEDTYEDIKGRYDGGFDMALYQVNAGFDALSAIRAGTLPETPSHFMIKIAVFGGLGLLLMSALGKRGRLACAACGHKSHGHSVLDEQRAQRYKHQTKSGDPDGRYRKNPVITTTQRILACDRCGEQFRHTFSSGG